MPTTLGSEVAGTIVAQGPGVSVPALGTRVVSLVDGGYAEYAVAKAQTVIPLLDDITYFQAIVLPIQGQSAYLLLEKAARLQKGERILIHAASGGVGSLAVQLARILDAEMIIGTAHTPDKLQFIRSLGADVALNTNDSHWVEQVMQATHGQGVHVDLDAVGGGIGQQSIFCLAPFGRMVVFGSLSDTSTPIFTQMLIPKCLTISGYNTLVQSPEEQMHASQMLMHSLAADQVKVILEHSFPLTAAAAAHRAIEGSKTRGKVVLTVKKDHMLYTFRLQSMFD